MSNPFSRFLGSASFISVTGRRFEANKFGKSAELMILAAKDVKDQIRISSELVRTHAFVNGSEIGNYDTSILIGEELDMLMMIRLHSHGPEVLFEYNCPSCGGDCTKKVDLRKFRRRLYESSNPDCPAKRVNAIADSIPDEEWDAIAFMAEYYSEVPEDYLIKHPPRLVWSPEEAPGLKVHIRFLRVHEKDRIAHYQIKKDEETMQVALEAMVVKIEWPDGPDGGINATERKSIKELLSQMPSAWRLQIRDFHDNQSGGVDNRVRIKCTHCQRVTKTILPFGQDFYSPRHRDR